MDHPNKSGDDGMGGMLFEYLDNKLATDYPTPIKPSAVIPTRPEGTPGTHA